MKKKATTTKSTERRKTSTTNSASVALVIVESPTKAKTISKFLPKNFMVEASMGHLRDLPQSNMDIPADLKKEEWAKLGVNVQKDFEPLYVIPKGKQKIVQELKRKMKLADILYLATDEDREGESISWHLIQLLQPKIPVKRMVFHEITKSAIEDALKNCRDIDMNLVKAQETRRVLDRIYGYTLSPLLWKKITYGLSAGRVQSTGLRMIAQRERERMVFQKAVYWDLKAQLKTAKENIQFPAHLSQIEQVKVASGKDFEDTTGKLSAGKKVKVLSEKEAKALLEKVKKLPWVVQDVSEKEIQSKPPIPFITSTLQQEGNRKLGMPAKMVMRTAQRLYEEGFITYMRTDSPALSEQAITAARNEIKDLYGKEYLSDTPRQFKSKSQGAQEAHEAVRPAGAEFVHPKDTGLTGQELALYQMIWQRTLACQMTEARKSQMSVAIKVNDCEFSASGTKILFAGFLRAYVEGHDDPESALEDKETLLPHMKKGETLTLVQVDPQYHETKPPARFSEAALIQQLEKEGIGRPSTYATIIGTIQDRGYVRKVNNALVPTFTGMAVIQLLENHFQNLVDYQFTSHMEEALDEIAVDKLDSLKYLKGFYLGKEGLKAKVDSNDKKIKVDESRTVVLPHLSDKMQVKIGRYGPYIIRQGQKEETANASIPEEMAPGDLQESDINDILEAAKNGPTSLGKHPETKEDIYCLVGRYGAYVQLGEVKEDGPKPRRAALPKELTPKTITLEDAVKLLSLPRELGMHPVKKVPIMANRGRFGPYVACDGEFRSLKKEDDVFTVTLERALELLSEEKMGRRKSQAVKELGSYQGKNIAVYEGRYGPFLKFGEKNVTLPEEWKKTFADITLDKAIKIVAAAKK